MLFEPVIEEGTAAETSCPNGGLLYANWVKRNDFVSYQTVIACQRPLPDIF
jgi:hypothetical protein